MALVDENGVTLVYVRPTKTRKGYWRRLRYDLELPSVSQRKMRALFASLALENRDTFGKADVVARDGTVKTLAATAKAMQDKMKGAKVAPEKPRVISDYVLVDLEAIKKMAETLREIKAPSS
jgi:hypothetical protein